MPYVKRHRIGDGAVAIEQIGLEPTGWQLEFHV